MMLFNIKPCRWQSVARQEFEQRRELLLGAAYRRRMTPPVCVHTENVSGYSRNPCSLNRERDTALNASGNAFRVTESEPI